jgi:hypothetical protein
MSKVLSFTTFAAAFSVALVSCWVNPGKAQQTQFGFPMTEEQSTDLPCYMVTGSGNTLNLVRLCSGRQQTTIAPTPRQSVTAAPRLASTPRRRLGFSQYLKRYNDLAETYPDSAVVRLLPTMPREEYAESVCDRLDQGKTLEEIRTEDIEKLERSGRLTVDNARKQNIEITLKLAPQYYCPPANP